MDSEKPTNQELKAKQPLPDQRLFVVSGTRHEALIKLLERPAQPSDGLRNLFSREAPWDAK
jgi:uncharacterized protein (DUF1778 family)